jgi:hypothetical protein
MNELELLRELGDETPLPELSELSEARARLTSAVAREQVPRSARAVVSPRRGRRAGRRRLALGGAVLAAAGAASAALIVAIGTARHAPPAAAQPRAAQPTAAQVLDRAAFVALRTTSVTPLPDQFVYTRVEQSGGHIIQSWLSVDGTRSSIVGPHTVLPCVNGVESRPCTPVRAYFPDMPTSASMMLPYLERTQGVRPDDINDLAKTVGYMLDSDYLLPAQQAAMYEFLAKTPGITVQPGVKDTAGRPGVGVEWSFEGSRAMLIFDARTYAYLGTTTWGVNGAVAGDALLKVAIVSQARILPSSTEPNQGEGA